MARAWPVSDSSDLPPPHLTTPFPRVSSDFGRVVRGGVSVFNPPTLDKSLLLMQNGGMSENTIGAKVRTIRETHGYSREYVAFNVGVSTSTIIRLEMESRVPKARTLKRIADFLDTTTDELLTGEATA